MRDERAAPETKGVTVKLLSALDLGPEIEGMAGRQLRMRMVTIEPGASSARFTTIKTGRAWSMYCRGRSLTIEMEWLRSMGREWAGPRIATPHIGLRIEERRRRWRSLST